MKRAAALLLIPFLLGGCRVASEKRQQKISMIVGIDVSGSFYNSGHFDDSLDFLAHYIHGHLNAMGGLKPLKALFVGSIGGNLEDEAKSFRPIQDFEGKSVAQIKADLRQWFPKSDALTDFNAFFRQAAMIAQKRNLSLSPITIVLLSDGLPDGAGKSQDKYEAIDLSPMEYLSRNTTLRLLYASPVASQNWETLIPRKRVRMWTVDNQVMEGWKAQMIDGAAMPEQEKFWAWVRDNVDFRVQPVRFRLAKK